MHQSRSFTLRMTPCFPPPFVWLLRNIVSLWDALGSLGPRPIACLHPVYTRCDRRTLRAVTGQPGLTSTTQPCLAESRPNMYMCTGWNGPSIQIKIRAWKASGDGAATKSNGGLCFVALDGLERPRPAFPNSSPPLVGRGLLGDVGH